MPRRGASVTQADIARAIRALMQEGFPNVRVVLKDGAAIVEPVPKDKPVQRNPWDPPEDDAPEPERKVLL